MHQTKSKTYAIPKTIFQKHSKSTPYANDYNTPTTRFVLRCQCKNLVSLAWSRQNWTRFRSHFTTQIRGNFSEIRASQASQVGELKIQCPLSAKLYQVLQNYAKKFWYNYLYLCAIGLTTTPRKLFKPISLTQLLIILTSNRSKINNLICKQFIFTQVASRKSQVASRKSQVASRNREILCPFCLFSFVF